MVGSGWLSSGWKPATSGGYENSQRQVGHYMTVD